MLFSERPEFKDVDPVPQDDGPAPACPIAYTAEFSDAMNYFRAMLKRNEMSERALALTTDVIELNAANYTVWFYRRRLLDALKSDLREELNYIAEIIEDHPKNYQCWYHRRAIVEKLGDGSLELEFTAAMLELDAKNYHCWAHRQWAMEHFNLFPTIKRNGLTFCTQLIGEDVRNNSAWNHRFFIINHTTGFTDSVIEEEIQYALEQVQRTPNNESAWNYIRGLSKKHPRGLAGQEAVRAVCDKLAAAPIPAAQALTTLLDTHLETFRSAAAGSGEAAAAAAAGTALCTRLAEIDPIRSKYWAHRTNAFIKK